MSSHRRSLRVYLFLSATLLAAGMLVVTMGCPGTEPWDQKPLEFPNENPVDQHTAISVVQSDNKSLRGMVSFAQAEIHTVEAGGERWSQVRLEGLEDGKGEHGYPGVPMLRRLVAVPLGARIVLRSAGPTIRETRKINLFPFQALHGEYAVELDDYTQELPPPELFAPQPFFRDAAAYARDALYPAEVCSVQYLGQLRDLRLAAVEFAAGQYNPVTRQLTLFSTMDYELAFEGGEPDFLTRASQNPFETTTGIHSSFLLNHDVLSAHVSSEGIQRFCPGEEFLILTHPRYRAPADQLADWKRLKGISTTVVNVNDGDDPGPDTKEQIDAFIDEHYDECMVRPSYILLFGDAEDIPTWIIQRLIKDPGVTIATDYPYSTYNTAPEVHDMCPDFALGRIPVNTEQQAQIVVDKIIQYESNPPAGPGLFYNQIAFPAAFECCRTGVPDPGWENGRSFIGKAEFFRDLLVGLGYGVERIYDLNVRGEYEGDSTPRAYSNGTPLPSPLRPEDNYPWDGDTNDVIAAFNEGRTIIVHFDHGGVTGWGHPHFVNSDLSQLTNGDRLPVVFNMDCSSGAFDHTCFAESALRMSGGGAVAVFAWTRMSNSYYPSPVMKSVLGGLWPAAFPEYADGTPKHRLGDLLNYSKLGMANVAAGEDPNSTAYLNAINHIRLYHLIGDPTLDIWTGSPVRLPGDIFLIPFPDFLDIPYDVEGAMITALQEQEPPGGVVGLPPVLAPIARGVVREGTARLPYINQPLAGVPLRYFATMPNAISTELRVMNP